MDGYVSGLPNIMAVINISVQCGNPYIHNTDERAEKNTGQKKIADTFTHYFTRLSYVLLSLGLQNVWNEY